MTGRWDRDDVLDAFEEAAGWYLAVVERVGAAQWVGRGLGDWTVRELVGHAARALSTVEEYLVVPDDGSGAPSSDPAPVDDDPVADAAAYFLGLRDNPALHRDVAERGRQAGAALPGDEASARREVAGLAGRVIALVRGAPDGASFTGRFGHIPFAAYLLTRTVELVVHGVDIARACGQDPEPPDRAASAAVAVVGQLGGAPWRGRGGAGRPGRPVPAPVGLRRLRLTDRRVQSTNVLLRRAGHVGGGGAASPPAASVGACPSPRPSR